MKYTFSADYECSAEIVTAIDGDVWDINGPHFTEMKTGNENDVGYVIGVTGEKRTVVTVRDTVRFDFDAECSNEISDN